MIDNKRTIIMASHNLRELEDICDNLGLLYKQNKAELEENEIPDNENPGNDENENLEEETPKHEENEENK